MYLPITKGALTVTICTRDLQLIVTLTSASAPSWRSPALLECILTSNESLTQQGGERASERASRCVGGWAMMKVAVLQAAGGIGLSWPLWVPFWRETLEIFRSLARKYHTRRAALALYCALAMD